MPAMPVIDEDGVLDCEKYKEFATNSNLHGRCILDPRGCNK